jgi:pentatricopeptide repeat protein
MHQAGIPITITTWNAVIAAFAEVGLGEEALKCFSELRSGGLVSPDEVTYACILKACGRIGAIDCGREIHAEVVNAGFESDPFVAGSLIDMYAKCSTLREAQQVFSKVLIKDSVLWSIFIAAYADHGLSDEVLKCVQQMQRDYASSSISSVHALRASDNIGDITVGQKLHSEVVEQGLDGDTSIRSVLVSMYANHGRFLEAHCVLDRGSNDAATWNALIAAYSSAQGIIASASIKKCLERMTLEGIAPDSTTHCWSLRCAAGFEFHLAWGHEIHREIVKAGFEAESSSCASLIEMYSNHGSFAEAHNVVNRLAFIDDAGSLMALCAGYARNMLPDEALNRIEKMQEEGCCCMKPEMFVVGLKACGALRSLDRGHELHSSLVKHGFDAYDFVNNTVVNMYGKCASLAEARHVFDNLLAVQDTVSWNALITGYVENGLAEEALNCFASMEAEADRITLTSVLKLCGSLGMVEKGREAHSESIAYGLETEFDDVNSAIVDMYAKCGLPKEASTICKNPVTAGDAVSLAAIVSGYACYGEVERVLDSVGKMRSKGMQEDGITMLSVLTSCCHAGRVEVGHKYLEGVVMHQNRAFLLADEHYNGIIDLAARAGQFNKAMVMIECMPLQPKLVMWIALLGACRKCANAELGKHAFAFAAELSAVARQASPFVLMANLHQDAYYCICGDEEEEDDDDDDGGDGDGDGDD